MHVKLTLRLDEEAINKGKRFAMQNGKSLSQVVQDYFIMLDATGAIVDDVLVSSKLQSLVGIGTGAHDEKNYREHLIRKNER